VWEEKDSTYDLLSGMLYDGRTLTSISYINLQHTWLIQELCRNKRFRKITASASYCNTYF